VDDRLKRFESMDVADYQAEQLQSFPALANGARTVASILAAKSARVPMSPGGREFRESTPDHGAPA
jgi:hypothetical protein